MIFIIDLVEMRVYVVNFKMITLLNIFHDFYIYLDIIQFRPDAFCFFWCVLQAGMTKGPRS